MFVAELSTGDLNSVQVICLQLSSLQNGFFVAELSKR